MKNRSTLDICVDIKNLENEINALSSKTRETSITLTKLQEARFFLEEHTRLTQG